MLLMTCLFLSLGLVLAQNKKVSGTVVDEKGQPVIGATVLVKGTTVGASTDVDGKFSISIPKNGKSFVVSLVGTETKEVAISDNLRIILVNSDKALGEVVVVAYGTARKESLTGSVSVVDSKNLEKRIGASVTGALEGSSPGIQVNNTYGEPGSTPSIRIRGFGTLSTIAGAAEPLYVVDGVPFAGNIADINPSDVESISILKDAASSALYGNRAANGVILITTKKAKGGQTSITLSLNQGIYNRGIPEYDRLEANQWMEAQWTGMKNYAKSLTSLSYDETKARQYATAHLIGDLVKRNIYNAADESLFDVNGKLIADVLPGYDDLDWTQEIARNGHRQEYALSGTTMGDKYNVYSSISYLKEQGYIINTDFERYTGRINSLYTPSKWFKLGINVSGSSQLQHGNSSAYGTYYANPFSQSRGKAPVYPIYVHNADGSYALDENGNKQYDLKSDYLSNRHIIYELKNNNDEVRRNTLSGQSFLTVSLPQGFDVTFKGDLNYRTRNRMKYENPNIGDGASNNGRLTNYAYQYNYVTLQQLLNWQRDINKHHIDLLAGHESYNYKMKLTYGMNTNMSVTGNYTMGNFTTNSYYVGYDDEYSVESYLSRARYNYDQKYFVEASLRRDGSSRFNPNNRWGNFFSIGGSWNIYKENFLQNTKWINNLKLRASYGEVGNDAPVDYYGYMALYNLDKNGGSGSLVKKSLAADDIKWETTQTVDLGLEGRLFDRMNFSIVYFDKRSKDLLFQVKLPLSAGSYPFDGDNQNMPQWKNIGTISNHGFELSADVDIVKTNEVKWNFGADATFLRNKVVKLPGGQDILHGLQRYSEGHSVYQFYTYHFEGVDQMTGNSLYTLDPDKETTATANKKLVTISDQDGNAKKYTTDVTYGLKQWSDVSTPDVYGSFHSSLSYNNFSLGFLFTYSLGGKMYDTSYQNLMSTAAVSASALHKDILNSWSGVPDGMTETSSDRINKNGIPIIDHYLSTFNNATSDRWLVDASYLIFKNLNVSYNFPTKKLQSIGIQGLTLNAGIENLFTVTARKGINPQATFSGYSESGEENDTYVTPRIYNVGLTLKF